MTQFITSYEEGVSKIAEVLANAREWLDLYIDSTGFDVIVRNKLNQEGISRSNRVKYSNQMDHSYVERERFDS